ncbi:MAG: hypothetical protein HFI93_11465 [Lachnospiraceae bacterium]|nr:hypothetical protein [Lachnospiraceae bacterium]
MKRKKDWCVRLCLFLCFFAGCVHPPSAPETAASVSAESTPVAASETWRGEEAPGPFGGWFQPSPVPEIEEEGLYYYHLLNEEEKQAYRQMYQAVSLMEEEEVNLTISDPSRIAEIYQYVLYDHPELFWLDHYSLYTYRMADRVLGYSFEAVYGLSREEKDLRQEEVLDRTLAILSGAPLDGDDYNKIKYIYEYVILSTEYDLEAEDNQNICSVLLNGRSVCQGYALTVQYLLERMGISCVTVTGKANGELHAWNLVWADGEPYYLDATWGDPQYARSEDELVELGADYISYEYLLVTSEEIARTHSPDVGVPLPVCTATADNYYVREGYYFEEWNPERFEALIFRCLEDGTGKFSVRCAGPELYQEIRTRLLQEQEIYDYLWRVKAATGSAFDANRILYGLNEEQKTIQFQLSE